jgi:MOSC domain-containing protein YiiM
MGTVVAVNISENKGEVKTTVPVITLRENYGVEGDAHADSTWHRQVSLLANESIDKMQGKGMVLKPGDFAENITTEGIDLCAIPVGAKIEIGETLLEMTQLGKQCHTGCAIRELVGDCIFPREGIFVKVLRGGTIKAGDSITLLKD